MIFHMMYDEIDGEPKVLVELNAHEMVTLNAAMFQAVRQNAEWVAEQEKDEHFILKLGVLTEKAALSGALDAAADKVWEEYEHWEQFERDGICDDCIHAMIDEETEKENEDG